MNRIANYRPQSHHVARSYESGQPTLRKAELHSARRGGWAVVGRSIMAVAVVACVLAMLILAIPAGLVFAFLDGDE